MSASDMLDQLARLAGIEDGWWDFYGQWRVVPESTKRVFLRAMGFAIDDETDLAQSLTTFEQRPWRRWLEPMTVIERGSDMAVTLTVPAARDKQTLSWEVALEGGGLRRGQVQVDTQSWIEERWLDGALVKRWRLKLPDDLALGYHNLDLRAADGVTATAKLAVTPPRAFVPAVVGEGNGAWGIATQIYALRDEHDWGVGTYGSLRRLAEGAARLGASTIGINPLHALFPTQPEKFSPYAPSSRRFLNVGYLDVEAVFEFAACRAAKRLYASPGFQANLDRLRAMPMVEYADVAHLQGPILEELYACFRAEHLSADDQRGKDFRAFQAAGGDKARLFCTFEALQRHFSRAGTPYWRHWPVQYQHPDNPAVAEFAATHMDDVEFFWWLQFLADQQLAAAHDGAVAAGAAIGLYRDLGVGIAGDGGDAWMEQDRLALGVSVGAPPDPLALKGQDWGLAPFNPIALKEAAFEPFIAVMRANMAHAGALRLDHAMALQRLYWVPPGLDADQGAYVRYPVDDLFRLVALESVRNRCLIIGEDLGTVPEGFRERMDRMALFAYRVMVFEKTGPDRFKRPEEFQPQALSIFATHDLPSLRGWWNGIDIASRARLDLYPRPGMADEERAARAIDRVALVAALVEQSGLAADFPTQGDLTDEQVLALSDAAHLYLGAARSRLMMVQMEDVLGLNLQMNLPGTVDQHPNWRRRFAAEVPTLLNDFRLVRMSAALNALRPHGNETP
ncbi:4-alpha-glucanotransferase [Magnetospirillum sulfuroxidans]|uniref:4-alpha-glucanotransferase n=1 Tax=Magnetospirillum sulfuroxidans TaxID=611300 RepID=A0ABS5ICU9_9PROT|nr:4-alpha-glucanotransferase [Magnetospirillum sulfuroxidans]MBR9972250.1 4-alpha-glucanotransferase [Magnetospirillum sulfuroxidans]